MNDLRIILDIIRDASDEKLRTFNNDLVIPHLLIWLRKLDPATVHEYRIYAESDDTKHNHPNKWGKVWGGSTDLLIHSNNNGLDDMTTALLLFIAQRIQPIPGGSAAEHNGSDKVGIYDDSQEYLSGLYDTLRYHPQYISTESAAPLLGVNIFTGPADARNALAALLTVTERITAAGLRSFLGTHDLRGFEPPYQHFHGFNGTRGGSRWLRNGELVEYVTQHPEDADRIAEIVIARETDDVAVIRMVAESGVSAVSSGVL